MPPDLTATQERVAVVEITAGPHTVTQIVGPNRAGIVEVHDSSAFVVVDEPQAGTLGIITRGPIGPVGPMGPQGPEGKLRTEDFHFASPLMEWVIHHTLDAVPVVTLYDLNGDEFAADVLTPDMNTVIVDFEVPMAGTAHLKA